MILKTFPSLNLYVLLFAVLTPRASDATPSEVFMERMDMARTGEFPNEGPTELHKVEKKNQEFGTIRNLIVAGNVAFFERAAKIQAVDLELGKLKWEFQEGIPPHCDYTAPFVLGEDVYFGCDKYIIAKNRMDGEEKWRFRSSGRIWTSPLMQDGILYFAAGTPETLYAIVVETKEIKWKTQIGKVMFSNLALSEGVIYFGSNDGFMHAVEARSGRIMWDFRTGNSVLSGPAVADNTVYFGSLDNSLYAVDAKTGSGKWTYKTQSPILSSPAVSNGRVYFGNRDGCLYAINAKTGEMSWNFQVDGIVDCSPAISGKTVYFGNCSDFTKNLTEEDKLREITSFHALNTEDGTQRWEIKTNSSTTGGPAIIDGKVIFGSYNGELYLVK